MAHLSQTAILVDDYDRAIEFFSTVLDFELVEDSPSTTNDGRAKRWVVVRPKGGEAALLIAKADGAEQEALIGEQYAGRVGFFLRVDDFDVAYQRLLDHNVRCINQPRNEPYATVIVFVDIWGNKWDLLGPA